MVSDLNKNFGGSTDLAQKRHGSADLHTPIHPPLIKIGILHVNAILSRLESLFDIRFEFQVTKTTP